MEVSRRFGIGSTQNLSSSWVRTRTLRPGADDRAVFPALALTLGSAIAGWRCPVEVKAEHMDGSQETLVSHDYCRNEECGDNNRTPHQVSGDRRFEIHDCFGLDGFQGAAEPRHVVSW